MIPEYTHRQLLILSLLHKQPQAGKQLRRSLAEEFNLILEGPAFYQGMQRLEESKLVRGRYMQEVQNGQIYRERIYQRTAKGKRIVKRALGFYDELARKAKICANGMKT